MRLFRYVLLGIVGVCSVVLSGCSFIWTTENGDPATPEDIKSSVEMCMCFMMKVMVFPLLQIL